MSNYAVGSYSKRQKRTQRYRKIPKGVTHGVTRSAKRCYTLSEGVTR